MTSRPRVILLLALSVLASCVHPPTDAADPCAGWEPIQISEATTIRMASDDPQGLREIIAHNEFGQKHDCW
jgi:hypothetical protein